MKVVHASPAAVSPRLLAWALQRAGVTPLELGRAVGTSAGQVDTWLGGGAQPTFRQARLAADRLRVPFGYLFLTEPPRDDGPIPDFRRVQGRAARAISPDLRDVILATLLRQEWLSEYRQEQGLGVVEVVGSFQDTRSVLDISDDIRSKMHLKVWPKRPSNSIGLLRLLVNRAEALGISVLRSGVVGSNTHRRLRVSEFRGFSLSDPYAPFVFINGADAASAQVFTCIHELCHVWCGQTGISGSDIDTQEATEALCNRVAAEVLVPAPELLGIWSDAVPFPSMVERAARRFLVSGSVIALRAFEAGLVDQQRLRDLLDSFEAHTATRVPTPGGDFFKTTIARNGRTFTRAVLTALDRQSVLVRDAAALLEVSPAHLSRLTKEAGFVE